MTQHASGFGRGITLTGNVEASEDVAIAGTIHGDVTATDHAVAVAAGGRVEGSISARDVTIAGFTSGTVLADVVEIRPGAEVSGRLLTACLILHEGALFNGSVQPERVDAATKVQQYRRAART
jgi:cytoskeletal protein CcmA (bactofilin family)